MQAKTSPETIQIRRQPTWARASGLLQRQGAFIALIAVAVLGVLRYGENFYSSYNIWETLRNNSYFALIALGMTFVIITGGIDLSVGSVVALSAVVAARLSPEGVYLATVAAMAAGLAVGLTNGVIISRFSVQPFIVTLASLLGARGLALLVADNATVPVDFQHVFIDIGQREIGPVPIPVILVAIAYLGGSLLLNFTRFGRHVLALGGNEEAARLAGLRTGQIIVSVYAMGGVLAGLAGAILAGLAFSGPPTAALGWELSAIAAVVVGGTLLTGGMGSVGATLAGVLLLGLIFNVLNFERGRGLFNLTVYWENVIRGVFLLLVVLFQNRLTRALRTRS